MIYIEVQVELTERTIVQSGARTLEYLLQKNLRTSFGVNQVENVEKAEVVRTSLV